MKLVDTYLQNKEGLFILIRCFFQNSSSMRSLFDNDDEDFPMLLTEQDHQMAATQLAHHVYTLSCIISHQMTSIDG